MVNTLPKSFKKNSKKKIQQYFCRIMPVLIMKPKLDFVGKVDRNHFNAGRRINSYHYVQCCGAGENEPAPGCCCVTYGF